MTPCPALELLYARLNLPNINLQNTQVDVGEHGKAIRGCGLFDVLILVVGFLTSQLSVKNRSLTTPLFSAST